MGSAEVPASSQHITKRAAHPAEERDTESSLSPVMQIFPSIGDLFSVVIARAQAWNELITRSPAFAATVVVSRQVPFLESSVVNATGPALNQLTTRRSAPLEAVTDEGRFMWTTYYNTAEQSAAADGVSAAADAGR